MFATIGRCSHRAHKPFITNIVTTIVQQREPYDSCSKEHHHHYRDPRTSLHGQETHSQSHPMEETIKVKLIDNHTLWRKPSN